MNDFAAVNEVYGSYLTDAPPARATVEVSRLPMDVLVVLASHPGEVVSPDLLIDEVWDGRPVTDEVITRCISVLRRSLGEEL